MKPDQQTAGLCTFDVFDYRCFEHKLLLVLPVRGGPALTTIAMPRAWYERNKRLTHILPGVVWARTYGYLPLVLALVTFVIVEAFWSNGNKL
jgi:hypothetical protein